jgi:hypothetical protein
MEKKRDRVVQEVVRVTQSNSKPSAMKLFMQIVACCLITLIASTMAFESGVRSGMQVGILGIENSLLEADDVIFSIAVGDDCELARIESQRRWLRHLERAIENKWIEGRSARVRVVMAKLRIIRLSQDRAELESPTFLDSVIQDWNMIDNRGWNDATNSDAIIRKLTPYQDKLYRARGQRE